jgi:hypothetical protein
MDHNEAVRECTSLFAREAQHAHDTAIEFEALVSVLPDEKSREIRELAEKVKEK